MVNLRKIFEEQFKEIIKGEEKTEEVLYPSTTPSEKTLNLYLKLFNAISFENLSYGILTFHTILGQLFKNFKIYVGMSHQDLRVHPFFVQQSGTGKSIAENFIVELATKLGIKCHIYTGEINEASLVGSFEVNQRGEAIEKPGILKTYEDGGILLFDEASILTRLAQKQYNVLLLDYLQAVMNPIGSFSNKIERHLKYGTITVSPKCSFIFITYPIKTELSEILKRGFFQRATLFVRDLNFSDWLNMTRAVKSGIEEGQDRESFEEKLRTYNTELTQLILRLNNISAWVSGFSRVFFDKSAIAVLDNFIKNYNDELMKLSGDIREIMDTYRNRSVVEIAKFATHKALLDKRLMVRSDDIEYGLKIVSNNLKSVLGFLETLEDIAKKISIIEARWHKLKLNLPSIKLPRQPDGSILVKDLVPFLVNYFGISEPSVYRHLEEWEEKSLIKWLDKKSASARIKF